MESIDYINALKDNDSPSTKAPAEFDFERALGQVEHFRVVLQAHFGYKPIMDDQMQDATHFAELQMQPEISRDLHAVVRFSKFGNLATILFPHLLTDNQLRVLVEELHEHGYTYIPSFVLESSYDGRVPGIDTWMTRFFHWP